MGWGKRRFRRGAISRYVLVGLLCVLTSTAWGQSTHPENVVKVLLLERIVSFLAWSAPPQGDAPLKVVILGDDDGLGAPLERLFGRRPFAGRALSLRYVARPNEIGDAQIVIIGRDHAAHVQAVLQQCAREGVLTVGDSPGLGDAGVAINFFREGSRVRFELRPDALKHAGIQASYKLMSLARLAGEP